MGRSIPNRVVFLLAVGFLALRAAAFEPLVSAIKLPDSIGGKAIWLVQPLKDGRMAIGFEGGLALGVPQGEWKIIATPNGQTVRTVSMAHSKTLVAGQGFAAFYRDTENKLIPIEGLTGENQCAEPISGGWLLSGTDGVWKIPVDGAPTKLAAPAAASSGPSRLIQLEHTLIVCVPGQPPQMWTGQDLAPAPELSPAQNQVIYWVDGNYRLTDKGLRNDRYEGIVAQKLNQTLLKDGVVGLADVGPWIITPTFGAGLRVIDKQSGELLTTWNSYGEIYYFSRFKSNFVFGTASGAYLASDPWKTAYTSLGSKVILDLQTNGQQALAVTPSETYLLDEANATISSTHWTSSEGAIFQQATLAFKGHSKRLLSPYIYGLAVCGETSAVSQDAGLTLLSASGEYTFIPIVGVASTLASDGRNFLVGTASEGVQVVASSGKVTGQLGSGRAAVREVRPGKVVLLFWDGTILDSDANALGRITWGNPRDAALVSGRLAVLVTRPDRDPVVGLLEGQSWQPLEIPGLAEIGAEKIAATDDFLFAAGPRGVIRVRLPIAKSAPPTAAWSWTSALVGDAVQLPSATDDHVGVHFRSLDLAPAPATFLRLRTTDGAWSTLRPGADFQLPVGWGRTSVTLQAERNGLLTENIVTVVRPWPLWLRWWAWPLHAAALAGLIFALVRWRTRTLKLRNLELEKHVSERTEQLRKASAVKEEFLASVSHEIRNPLNGVVGICAILADREVGPSEKTLVRTLGGCADQLRSMLDDILDFSRIERGQVTLTNVDFEASSLVEEAARAMDPELTACSLMLPDQPAWLHGDSGKLRQIVCNLISNALKYGVPSEAGVEMRLSPAGAGRTRLRLAVRNTGPTIPPEELTRLFESFQRGANTGSIPGSGLGLAVCRRLAHAMGGRITAASHEGTTEFALELTLVNAQPPAKAVGLPDTVSRALAIEDEDYNRIALGHVLRSLGYTIDWAVDGASALKFASTQQYDLVLTDWRLPDTDGGELCRQLVRVLPRPTPPIVAITAYSTKEKLEEAKAAGMTGFVTKPVTKEKLERVIRGLSEGLRPKRSLDTHTHAAAAHPLASLGDIAPSTEQLAHAIERKWREVAAMTRLHDPRAGSEAHMLRGQLLQAGEETAAEQVSLLEDAVDRSDWPAVARLLPEVEMLVTASQTRLKA